MTIFIKLDCLTYGSCSVKFKKTGSKSRKKKVVVKARRG